MRQIPPSNGVIVLENFEYGNKSQIQYRQLSNFGLSSVTTTSSMNVVIDDPAHIELLNTLKSANEEMFSINMSFLKNREKKESENFDLAILSINLKNPKLKLTTFKKFALQRPDSMFYLYIP